MVRQVERCRAFIPLPDGEEGQIRCGAVAEEQCRTCSEWFCAEESAPHLLVDVRCGGKFCEGCLTKHRLSRECELGITEQDLREFVG